MIYRTQIFIEEKDKTEIRHSYRLDLEGMVEAYLALSNEKDTVILSVLESGKERLLNERELKEFKKLVKTTIDKEAEKYEHRTVCDESARSD